jgi:hypothetical protein
MSTPNYAPTETYSERERRVARELTLEGLVDQTSVVEVLDMLATICFEKSEHLRVAWQDSPYAAKYERMGNRLLGFQAKMYKFGQPFIGGRR